MVGCGHNRSISTGQQHSLTSSNFMSMQQWQCGKHEGGHWYNLAINTNRQPPDGVPCIITLRNVLYKSTATTTTTTTTTTWTCEFVCLFAWGLTERVNSYNARAHTAPWTCEISQELLPKIPRESICLYIIRLICNTADKIQIQKQEHKIQVTMMKTV